MLLYHGTRQNSPNKIYGDMEESFNINYSNMGNYGKGIYFAKNSNYSHTYAHMSSSNSFRQMFECLVLVGDSEIWNGSQKFDTNFKDHSQTVKYESVCNKNAGDIFVVFKNRRAYPLYLISY